MIKVLICSDNMESHKTLNVNASSFLAWNADMAEIMTECIQKIDKNTLMIKVYMYKPTFDGQRAEMRTQTE